MGFIARPLRRLLLLLIGLLCVSAQKVHKTEFDSQLYFPQYFADSDTILLTDASKLWRSEDGGATWEVAKQERDGEEIRGAQVIFMHPFNNEMAFALSPGEQMWYTHDQGKTWVEHWLPDGMSPTMVPGRQILSFHASDPKKIVLNTQECIFRFCMEQAWYSNDGLQTIDPMRQGTRGCSFARSTSVFKSIADEGGADRVLCITKGQYSSFLSDQRLAVSDDLFKSEIEPVMSEGRTVGGIISMAFVKGYIVAAARAENTLELALFVSVDGLIWHQADFGMDDNLEEAYTVLESTNYSMQIIVQNNPQAGVLLSSNSNGTYFQKDIEHVQRHPLTGITDFEKVAAFQGIILVNTVENWEEIEEASNPYTIRPNRKTQITFHDGKKDSWKQISAGDDRLHLHSVTEANNVGRVFSSGAPGVMLGVGNTGEYLKDYEECDLFVSNNAGRNWEHALEGPHKYEFGDQGNVLLAVPAKEDVKTAKYSVDHGETWEDLDIDPDEGFKPWIVTTTPDSTSLNILIMGIRSREGEEDTSVVYSVNFDEVFSSTCGEGDMETFQAISDDEPCVMGHRQKYRRRKRDAKCFIRSDFKDPVLETTPCTCTREDFECDFNFIPKDGKCEPSRSLKAGNDQCKDPEDTFKASSGFRLIPGNECNREGGDDLDEEIERPCSQAAAPNSGKVTSSIYEFKEFKTVIQVEYLERSSTSSGDDETVLILTNTGMVFYSKDHGKKWTAMNEIESKLDKYKISRIVRHEYNTDAVFFITDYDTVFYSYNRCKRIESFEAPHAQYSESTVSPLSFHQDLKNSFIWTGEDCASSSEGCHGISSLTRDRGDNWKTLVRYSDKCEFILREGRDAKLNETVSQDLIYCNVRENEDPEGRRQLVKSTDFFEHQEPVFDDVIDFATMSEFVIVAKRSEDNYLTVNASVNGGPFAAAQLPPTLNIDAHPLAYTVLQSETHAIFLHVTTNNEDGWSYGRLVKSNSNGTYYVSSIDAVNRNDKAFVDFEKVKGIEGVSLVNVVANLDEQGTADKKLQTKITHNDGADWAYLDPPAKGPNGRNHECRRKEGCQVHLFGYTQKRPQRTYSSDSAVGLLVGNGNFGTYLDESDDAKITTFMSADGGITWKAVAFGSHYWAFGDQGSIVVLVPEGTTNSLDYTLDQGDNWQSYQFSESEIRVSELLTLPSDNSKQFLILGFSGSSPVSVNVDFSELYDRECELDDANPDADDQDYYSWSPKHPFEKDNNCLFGHVALYHRKKPKAECWNGRLIDNHGFHSIKENCTCMRHDFECDFNYQKDTAGNCELVPGFDPPDHTQVCRDDPNRDEWYRPTGYRRIPLDTCEGGRELERWSSMPCEGHEEQWQNKHGGLSGFALFFVAFVIPFSAAGAIGWYFWRNWDGKLGAIRLGEGTPNGVLDIDKPWIRYPVMLLSALVAVGMAVPGVLGSAWRGLNNLVGRRSGVYNTRASFARGRGEYTIVDEDEDELLGDDEEDEV